MIVRHAISELSGLIQRPFVIAHSAAGGAGLGWVVQAPSAGGLAGGWVQLGRWDAGLLSFFQVGPLPLHVSSPEVLHWSPQQHTQTSPPEIVAPESLKVESTKLPRA